MLAFAIFLLHIIFFAFIFAKLSKKENYKHAFYNFLFNIIVFTVGWALTTMLANAVFPMAGYSKELNIDTISLIILTIAEATFYKFYYSDLFSTSDGMGK